MPSECVVCRAPLSDANRFCPACGAPVRMQSMMTGLAAAAHAGRLVSSDAVPAGGFTPGSVIAGRYRIIGLLGRGGMGEVYRADDLKLGQAVALKFLPPDLADDPVRRERFFAEVRIARQISHPSVCRVYDIAEFEGRHFLSMEYVDGEDLASLLQRIGNLPGRKAAEIARQLCAGVAAAHDKGVLHRDLKPANVMIDGRGRVRVTDFGLAVAMDQSRDAFVNSGTPAYMAPEQLAGEPASVRSDIYALGLVLYELYTGTRAFTASTLPELRAQKERDTPTAPSEISRDVDPIVERLIQRCIEKDPRNRPATVLQIAAALPGGDPLAAALAAGETPSPEMVAASDTSEGLRPAVAWTLLAIVLAAISAYTVLGQKAILQRRVPLAMAPAAMAERARDIARAAGHVAPPADSVYGAYGSRDYIRHHARSDGTADKWDRALPDATTFWYRQAPRALMRTTNFFPGAGEGDPPRLDSGDVTIRLDARGQLRDITAIPPQVLDGASHPAPVDWQTLLRFAGVDPATATPVTPEWAPLYYGDQRAAWTAEMPGLPGTPVRIEAASFAGRAVNFFVIAPWVTPERVIPQARTANQLASDLIGVSLLAVLLLGSAFFARRNVRLGRGDRRGATRLAVFAFAALMIVWLAGEDHALMFWEIYLFVSATGFALFIGALLWLLYVAVEPFVRRNAPRLLVSWSRLITGAAGDPLVGRDMLIGCAAGSVAALLTAVNVLVPGWLGQPADMPLVQDPLVLDVPHLITATAASSVMAVFVAIGVLFLLFVGRLVLRRQTLVIVAVAAVMSASGVGAHVNLLMTLPLAFAVNALMVTTLARVGLVAVMVAGFVVNQLGSAPAVLPFGAWHSGLGLAALGLIVALAVFGFYRSLGGRSPFGALPAEA